MVDLAPGLSAQVQQRRLAALCDFGADPATVGGYDIRLRRQGRRYDLRRPLTLAGEDGQHQIGCTQTPWAGAVVYALAAEGRLDPRAPIAAVLPELREAASHPTALDLLSYSSGYLAPDYPVPDWQTVCRHLQAEAPAFPPGRVVNFSGLDYRILQEWVRRATGQDIYAHIEDCLLGPLGLALHRILEAADSWNDLALAPDEHMAVLERLDSEAGGWGSAFFSRLETDRVQVCRSAVPAATKRAIACSWGFQKYHGGLWGGGGHSGRHATGLRLAPGDDFFLVGVVEGSLHRRDIMLDRLAGAFGHGCPAGGRATPIGALNGVPIEELTGAYRAGRGLSARVEVQGERLFCRVYPKDQPSWALQAMIGPDGVILGDSRQPEMRLEFFANGAGPPAFRFGLWAFIRS